MTTKELIELDRYEQSGTVKADTTSGEVLATQQEAADYAGVSTRTIRKWVVAGMPQAGHKGYLKLYLDQFRQGGRPEASGNRARIQAAVADIKEAEAELKQMKRDLEKGMLIRKEQQIQKDVQRALVLKRAFGNLGRILAPRVAGSKSARQCNQFIDKAVKQILENFAGKPSSGNTRK